jgi:hypothetical protein
MILVVYGKVGKGQSVMCIHGGAKLIVPLIQDCRFLSLVPLTINIPLKEAGRMEQSLATPRTQCAIKTRGVRDRDQR